MAPNYRESHHAWRRARDLGVPFDGTPGRLNEITDVTGVTVGQLEGPVMITNTHSVGVGCETSPASVRPGCVPGARAPRGFVHAAL